MITFRYLLLMIIIVDSIALLGWNDMVRCSLFWTSSCRYPRTTATDNTLRWLVVVTPTFRRLTQKSDLTRLSQTLSLIDRVHWIVVEDGRKTDLVSRLLDRSKVQEKTYLQSNREHGMKGKGMSARNVALDWLRSEYYKDGGPTLDGVLYFADDDNTYDTRLFTDYIRNVNAIGVWAVGLVGGSMVESPKADNETGRRLVGWQVSYMKSRRFATDMAGFAVNLKLILNNTAARFNTSCKATKFETCFLETLVPDPLETVEVFGHENSAEKEVLVWHTKTKHNGPKTLPKNGTNDFEV